MILNASLLIKGLQDCIAAQGSELSRIGMQISKKEKVTALWLASFGLDQIGSHIPAAQSFTVGILLAASLLFANIFSDCKTNPGGLGRTSLQAGAKMMGSRRAFDFSFNRRTEAQTCTGFSCLLRAFSSS